MTEVGPAEIIIDHGHSPLRVDTRLIPRTLEGLHVQVDDPIVETGRMDADRFLDRREVEATTITRLTDVSR